MPKLVLYHAVPSRSATVRWMLEEIGQPFDVQLLDLTKNEQQKPEYLAINPMGKVPSLKHGDAIITEVAAICCYLADEFPDAKLNIPVGNPKRGEYLKWLFYGPSCVEPAIIDRVAPRKEEPRRGMVGYGDFDTVVNVLKQATANAKPYLMGEQFTAADVVIGAGLRWTMMFKVMPELPEFKAYVGRLNERPALKRADQADQALKPK